MKTLNILLLFTVITLFGCKKKEDQSGHGYNIRINVNDGVSYSVKLQDGNTVNYNVIPPAKNASTTIENGGIKGKTLFVVATVNPFFKDEQIEVIVTNRDTGEVIGSEKSTDQVTIPWTVK